jgi:hypothetical protein
MKRLPVVIMVLPLMFLLGGCSIFGVATKGEMERQAQQDAQARQMMLQRVEAVNGRLADISQQLDDIERRMEPRLASLETDVQELDQDMDNAKQQLMDLELGLRADLDKVSGDVQVVFDDMLLVRSNMNQVSTDAQKASRLSEQALEAQFNALVEERDRLMTYLALLDEKISKWHIELQNDELTPVQELDQQALAPEELVQPARMPEQVDQQALVPEQPADQSAQQQEEPFRLGPHNRQNQ